VTNPTIKKHYADIVMQSLTDQGFQPTLCEIPDGEQFKTLATVASLYDQFLAAGLDRKSPILALGGGVAGVLIGAAAAHGVEGVLNFPARVTPGIVLAGLGLSVGVGLAAGYWPARNASNLPVVDALRTE
jgi:3-dehydroquinate synthetase